MPKTTYDASPYSNIGNAVVEKKKKNDTSTTSTTSTSTTTTLAGFQSRVAAASNECAGVSTNGDPVGLAKTMRPPVWYQDATTVTLTLYAKKRVASDIELMKPNSRHIAIRMRLSDDSVYAVEWKPLTYSVLLSKVEVVISDYTVEIVMQKIIQHVTWPALVNTTEVEVEEKQKDKDSEVVPRENSVAMNATGDTSKQECYVERKTHNSAEESKEEEEKSASARVIGAGAAVAVAAGCYSVNSVDSSDVIVKTGAVGKIETTTPLPPPKSVSCESRPMYPTSSRTGPRTGTRLIAKFQRSVKTMTNPMDLMPCFNNCIAAQTMMHVVRCKRVCWRVAVPLCPWIGKILARSVPKTTIKNKLFDYFFLFILFYFVLFCLVFVLN